MTAKRLVKLYDHSDQKTYAFPNGSLATPEIISRDFPCASSGLKCVIITDASGETLFTLQTLSSLADAMGLDSTLDPDVLIKSIETQVNTLPAASIPSPEERIAAALEYRNLLDMPAV